MTWFEINYKNISGYIPPTLTIELIGHYSIDGDSQYHDDLSQLKYYIPSSHPNNVCYDLDKDFTATHHRSTSYVKLDDLLKWLLDHNRFENPLSTQNRWLDVDFICRRGVLKTLLYSLYKKQDGWIICASKYRGTIYLCEFYTDEKEQQHTNPTEQHKQHTSWGYKFEQYMVADHPSHKPDLSIYLNECEAFHCVSKARFGDHSLLYESEIDGILSQQPIMDTLVGKTNFEIIELKTFPKYNDSGDISGGISQEKASIWWAQNYLGGVDRIICGLKDKSVVKMIKEYPTDILPKLPKFPCDVEKCKIFCKVFLDNVKKIVTKDYNECMYKFHWYSSVKYVISYNEEDPNNEQYHFLKSWFVEKVEENKDTSQ